MLVDEDHNEGVEPHRIRAARRAAFGERLDQRIFRELSPLVEIIGGTDALDDPCHAVAIAITAASQPHSRAEIDALHLAVLPDTQRGPPGHEARCGRARRQSCPPIEKGYCCTLAYVSQAESRLFSLYRFVSQSITSLSGYRTCRPIFA